MGSAFCATMQGSNIPLETMLGEICEIGAFIEFSPGSKGDERKESYIVTTERKQTLGNHKG